MKSVDKIILDYLEKHPEASSTDLTQKLGISRQALHRYLKKLLEQNKIQAVGASRKTTRYQISTQHPKTSIHRIKRILPLKNLDENFVFQEIDQSIRLPGWARDIARYAFTEILNNAIDHSKSVKVAIHAEETNDSFSFVIQDSGIGIFCNLQKKLKLKSELEAIQELLKGKQTTQPQKHSGEGIFFTSKIADKFIIESHLKKLTYDNSIPDIFIEDITLIKGTRVSFELQLKTPKSLTDLFREYSSDSLSFDKTKIHVHLYKIGSDYISRSQAKRLLLNLDKFSEIILDFDRISTVGQGFADEVFRVYANAHPKIRLIPTNMNENVRFMIERTQK